MSWPQWPGAAMPQAQPPIMNPTASVGSAPPPLMSTTQYTPEQWAQMQHQNWQQWAQWQQQFQQWQQQYGAEYQKSMNALAQSRTTPTQPPVSFFNSAPPPLPAEPRPPPPADAQPPPPNMTQYPSFTSAPPPLLPNNFSTAPPMSQSMSNELMNTNFNTLPPTSMQNQNKKDNSNLSKQSNYPNSNLPNKGPRLDANWKDFNHPPNESEGRAEFGGKRPHNLNISPDIKRNKMDLNSEDNKWSNASYNNQLPHSQDNKQWNSRSTEVIPKPNCEELTEAEKKFDKQFTDWQAQFQKWKEQNANHPDKEQYKEYEKKWEAWRNQLLERREQMRRKRLGLITSSPQLGIDKMQLPKLHHSQAQLFDDKKKLLAKPAFVGSAPSARSAPYLETQLTNSIPQNMHNQQGFRSNTNVNERSNIKPIPGRPHTGFNDHHSDYNRTNDDQNDPKLQISLDNKKIESNLNIKDCKDSNFMNSVTSDTIPGLDLVKDTSDTDNVDQFEESQTQKPDLEVISRGINSILGDQKILNMLSLVTQSQSKTVTSNTITMAGTSESNSKQMLKDPGYDNKVPLMSEKIVPSINNKSQVTPGFNANDKLEANTTFHSDNNFSQLGAGQFDPNGNSRGNDFNDLDNTIQDTTNNWHKKPYDNVDNFTRTSNTFNRDTEQFNTRRGNFGPNSENFIRQPNEKFENNSSNLNFDNFNTTFNRNSEQFNRTPDTFHRNANFAKRSDYFDRNLDNFDKNSEYPLNKRSDNFHVDGPHNFDKMSTQFNTNARQFRADNISSDTRNFESFNRNATNTAREPEPFMRRIESSNFNTDKFRRDFDNFDTREKFGDFEENLDNCSRNVDYSRCPDYDGEASEGFANNTMNLEKQHWPVNDYNRNPDILREPNFDNRSNSYNRNSFRNENDEFYEPNRLNANANPPTDFQRNRDSFELPKRKLDINQEAERIPVGSFSSVGSETKCDDFEIWKPSTVLDYDHRPLKTVEREVMLEPIFTFDYRHKELNRIPYPQRPKWLSDIVKNYPEFDLIPRATRPFEPHSFNRYPSNERFDNFPKYENRENFDERDRNFFEDRERRPFEDRNRRYGVDLDRKLYDDREHRLFDKSRRMYDDREPIRSALNSMDENHSMRRNDSKYLERQYSSEHLATDNHINKIDRKQINDENKFVEDKSQNMQSNNNAGTKSNITLIEDLLCPPGRFKRPTRLVIILRGPPGSGKSFLTKVIKDKEVENGGSAPRILCLDDYFMVEQEKEIIEEGRKVKIKEMVYEYEECMEASYRQSLMKAFKKTVTDGYFNFIIVDNVNEKVKYFGEMWSFAKQNGFQVYVCQLELDVQTCTKRNIHGRSEIEIERCVAGWEETPSHHPILDATGLIQAASIPEVEMEEINSPANEIMNEQQNSMALTNPYEPQKTMEDYLQMDDEWVQTASTKPGQKRVRWADLEERKQQEKMRAIGFVVGHTNWDRMMDPTMGSAALTQTKYIERHSNY